MSNQELYTKIANSLGIRKRDLFVDTKQPTEVEVRIIHRYNAGQTQTQDRS